MFFPRGRDEIPTFDDIACLLSCHDSIISYSPSFLPKKSVSPSVQSSLIILYQLPVSISIIMPKARAPAPFELLPILLFLCTFIALEDGLR